MHKISVIIPMWNVEKYIGKAIKSIQKQTVKDIEIICIDDGSIDNTVQVVESFMKNDNRIKLLRIEHSGVSIARNTGLNEATGEYIFFLDSDDIVFNNFVLEHLYNIATTNDYEVVLSSFFKVAKNSYSNVHEHKEFTSGKELIEDLLFMKLLYNPSTYFCKRSFIEEHNLRFVEHLYMEDLLFLFDILLVCKNIIKIKFATIFKITRENAITNSFGKYNSDIIYIYDIILQKLNKIYDIEFSKKYYLWFVNTAKKVYLSEIQDEILKNQFTKLYNEFIKKYNNYYL